MRGATATLALGAFFEAVEVLADLRGLGRRIREGDRAVLLGHRGPEPPSRSVGLGEGHAGGEVDSELIVPIRLDAGVVGVIAAESSRLAAFSEEDRYLLERVAAILAPFLVEPTP